MIHLITRWASALAKGRWRLKSKSRLYSCESEQAFPVCLPSGLVIILFKIVQY